MAILRIQQASASYLSAVVMSLPQTLLFGLTAQLEELWVGGTVDYE
ncbi:MAG: hypothetical protein ACQCN3_14455 [Candidatus Bathyarchaeia archaeon]